MTIREISPQIVENYLADLSEDGLSANTVRHHLTLIKSVFNDEIKNGAPLLNPARCVKPPKMESYEAKTYSVEELGKLFKLFEGDEIEDIVHIAVLYGLRRSEICGLRWQDVDFANGVLHVRHKISEVKLDGERRLVKSNTLKTESSRRSFPLSENIRAKLLSRLEKIKKNKAENINYWRGDENYVFVHSDGRLITPNYVTDRFRQKLKASGFPHLRFHDLRHRNVKPKTQNFCLFLG